MTVAKSRTITFVVAIATLASNVISSLLFSQLPDDPYHLAGNFRWYLHFANILSFFGLLGSLRQHALSIAIFSNYLLLDTILCAIPRVLLLGLFQTLSAPLCASPPASPFSPEPLFASQSPSPSTTYSSESAFSSSVSPASQWERLTGTWTPAGCYHIVRLAQLALAAGVVAGAILQFVGALYVREYARELWMREIREDAAAGRVVGQMWIPEMDEERFEDDVVGWEKL